MASIINAATSGGLISTADTSGILQLQTAGTTAVTVNASQNVGIGTTSPTGKLDVGNVAGAVSTGDFIVTTGSTTASVTVGRLSSTGSDNTTFNVRNRIGTSLFNVSPDGVKTATTISVGAATPSLSGAGITFPATQSASSDANTLDDYEEGTWTPALVGSTSGSAASYSSRTGTYTKIGNTVIAYMAIDVLSSVGIVGDVNISGLPFNLTGSNPATAISYINTFGVNVVACGVRTFNSTQLLLEYRTAAAQSNTLYPAASLPASGPDFIVTITYIV